jgi:NAD(P)-dependent dehydrogenase (short-subunit alcohol dehydrogenase family)
VRRAEAASALAAELGGRFTPLTFDVTDAAAVQAAAAEVARALGGRRLTGLVNNAGVAVAGPLELLPIEELRHQLEVNLVAPLVVTRAFLPLLGTDPARAGPPGRVVMMSSISGRIGSPFLGPYCASKHGLEGLSECLRRELQVHGIGVSIVGPGMVATPIWDKAEEADVGPYLGGAYGPAIRRMREYVLAEGRKGWPAERIAEVVHHALCSPRPRVRYAPVAGRVANWILPRLLPARALDWVMGRMLGLRPGARG